MIDYFGVGAGHKTLKVEPIQYSTKSNIKKKKKQENKEGKSVNKINGVIFFNKMFNSI